jgi:hypothetical protein
MKTEIPTVEIDGVERYVDEFAAAAQSSPAVEVETNMITPRISSHACASKKAAAGCEGPAMV